MFSTANRGLIPASPTLSTHVEEFMRAVSSSVSAHG
jgi:hypothetical protein